MTYIITYTDSVCADLDDDFTIKTIIALTYEELCVMIHNITEFFGGTLIHVEEKLEQRKHRKVMRRAQKSKTSEKRPHTYS